MNVIITGCNRGIGLAILIKFANEGWNIWACVRKETEEFSEIISNLSESTGVRITPIYFDMTDDAEIKAGMKKIFDDKEPIHALVNNAGIGHYELFQRTSVARGRELFNINFFAPFQIMQYVLRKMERQGYGAVVNMSSIASYWVNKGDGLYGASKAALSILTRDVAAEYGGLNIRINAVAPGPTNTGMIEKYDKVGEAIYTNIAMKRLGHTEEIANAVYFLASEDASFINGEVLTVDGGRC